MKIAVSIPDEIFEEVEELVKRRRVPRSQLYAKALAEYLDNHRDEHVTAALDSLYKEEQSVLDAGLNSLQEAALFSEDW